MSVALVSVSAVFVTVATADYAYAKGGNGGGNGNGGGKSGDNGKSADRGGKAGGKSSATVSRSGGGGGLLDLFRGGKSKSQKQAKQKKQRVKQSATTQSAVVSSPKPASKPSNGNSWKTRLDDGILDTPANELRSWNSAKRSPQALMNMVEKYEATGKANGAGGMIAAFVVAHGDYADAIGPMNGLTDALQTAVDDGLISYDDATALLSGDLNDASLAADLAALNDILAQEVAAAEDLDADATEALEVVFPSYGEGGFDCGSFCDDPRVGDLQDQAGALDTANSYFDDLNMDAAEGEELDLAEVVDTFNSAQMTLDDQTSDMSPTMLGDIRDLLDDVFPYVTEPQDPTGLVEPVDDTVDEAAAGDGSDEGAGLPLLPTEG